MNVKQKDSIAKRTITATERTNTDAERSPNAKRSHMQKDHVRKRRWMAL